MGGSCCIGNCCIMNNAVGDFFRDLFCSDSGCSVSISSNDSEEHAKKIANELAKMIKKVEEDTSASVEETLTYLNEDIARLLEEIEKIDSASYGGIHLKIDKQAIERQNKELEKEAKNLIANMMRDRLVQTDPELSAILEERDDKKRNKNFEAFVIKLRTEANQKLWERVQRIVQKQHNILSSEISGRLNEIDRTISKTSEAYNEILKLKKNNESNLEEKRIAYTYPLGVCNLILHEMDDQEEES